MLRVKRMDMIIHVSVQDLQRNLDKHSRVGQTLDIFAPGWRECSGREPSNGCSAGGVC